jgi:hypothetical protein
MSNVFLLYMPPGNHEAMVHYQDTISGHCISLHASPAAQIKNPFFPEQGDDLVFRIQHYIVMNEPVKIILTFFKIK